MAISIANDVWDHAPVKGATLLVALALADNANKQTRETWPGVADLARRARVSERQVRTCLRALERAKVIVGVERPGRTSLYTFTDPSEWVETEPQPRKPASAPTPEAHFRPEETSALNPTSGGGGSLAQEPRKPASAEPLEPSFNQGLESAQPATTRRKKRNPETILPDEWEPTGSHHELAGSLGVDVRREMVKFRDHHLAKQTLYRDWDRAFNTWLRRAAEFAKPKRSQEQTWMELNEANRNDPAYWLQGTGREA